MRLLFFFYLLATAAVCSARDERNELRPVSRYNLSGGIPDGTIITFFFKHNGSWNYPEPVDINFYDYPIIDVHEVYDVTAHLKLHRDTYKPVASNSYEYGKGWLTEERMEQPPGEMATSTGYWRLDVYKHNRYQLNVFFQGFWSDVRTFKRSLNDIQNIYIISRFVDWPTVKVHMKKLNSHTPLLSVEQFKEAIEPNKAMRKLVSFPHFPLGSHIEVSAVLRASAGSKWNTPSLVFKPAESAAPFIMKIIQTWMSGSERLSIHHEEGELYNMKEITHCIKEAENGDLQHIHIARTSQNEVTVTVFYKSNGEEGISCAHELPAERAANLDKPFDIMSHDGAVLLHLQHSIPRDIAVKND